MSRALCCITFLTWGCSRGVVAGHNGTGSSSGSGSSAGTSSGSGSTACSALSCGAHSVCEASSGACVCSAGYSTNGTSCVDVDECATGSNDCNKNATCSNSDGSFTCTCDKGLFGDGKSCRELASLQRGMCELRADATIWCWGRIANVAPNLTPTQISATSVNAWRAVTGNQDHACAIAADRNAWCWGRNEVGQLGVAAGSPSAAPLPVTGGHSWRHLAAGQLFTCGIDMAGALWCWGDNQSAELGSGAKDAIAHSTPTQLGVATDWVQLSADFSHACAINQSGALFCWGDNDNLQSGQATVGDVLIPTRVGSSTWAQVSTAELQTCAIDVQGGVSCFGLTSGVAPPSIHADPQAVDGVLGATMVSTGFESACAISASTTWCWGDNTYGELTSTSVNFSASGIALATPWSGVAVGFFGACAARGDTSPAQCWGSGQQGSWGDGTDGSETVPRQTDSDYHALTAGPNFVCGIKLDGSARCWGSEVYGQLASDLTSLFVQTPGTVNMTGSSTTGDLTITGWASLSAGGIHTCGIDAADRLFCWGNNQSSQLGFADDTSLGQPAYVPNPSGIAWGVLTTGESHSCATDTASAHATYCWGAADGAGSHTAAKVDVPTVVTDSASATVAAVELTGGYNFSCALKASGEVWCWGTNDQGQLGRGDPIVASSAPFYAAKVADPSGLPGTLWSKVSSAPGAKSVCGISTLNDLFCWGANDSGQLGLGALTPTTTGTPTQVGSTAGWTDVAVGSLHACGVQNGILKCWGAGTNGQLGAGTKTNTTSPQTVVVPANFSGWAAGTLALGDGQSCGLDLDGVRFCWGANGAGQLGDSNAWRATPQVVTN